MLTIDTVYRFIKLHPVEIVLILLASIITVISFVLQFKNISTQPTVLSAQTSPDDTVSINNSQSTTENLQPATLSVEVSGAVVEPDVYEVAPGTRLKDVIDMAGGLSDSADARYVSRNYNLAKFVGDQEKIYIPYTWDIVNGTFVEQKRILEYLQPLYLNPPVGGSPNPPNRRVNSPTTQNPPTALTLSLNTSSLDELETLPGIGPVTAKKIIDNRPYTAIDELLSKKVVNQSTYDKIKNFITP